MYTYMYIHTYTCRSFDRLCTYISRTESVSRLGPDMEDVLRIGEVVALREALQSSAHTLLCGGPRVRNLIKVLAPSLRFGFARPFTSLITMRALTLLNNYGTSWS